MSKASDRFASLTNKVKQDMEKPIAVAGEEAGTPSSPLAATTGPGKFMANTFGREAADRARAEAEKDRDAALLALEELRKSKSGIIKLDDIVCVEGRRRTLTEEQYAELKSNLEHNRLINQVTVRKLQNGKYELIAGHNRVAIYQELGRDEIMASVLDLADDEAVAGAFYSNLLSPSLTHYQQYKGYIELQQFTGKTQAEMAKESGLSESHISNILAFDDLPAESKKLLDEKPWIMGSDLAANLRKAIKSGKAEKVIAAVQALYDDESLTEKQALAMVADAPAAKPVSKPAKAIKVGQRTFGNITSRNGVIALKLHKEFATDAEAAKWADRIEEFVKSKIAAGEL